MAQGNSSNICNLAVSKIDICNLALAMLGAEAIRDFSEPTKRAHMSEIFYDYARDYLLSKFDWPFARSLNKLNPIAPAVLEVPNGQFAFSLPADCITPRDMYPQGSSTWWEVIGDLLYCKQETDVYLYFTKRITDSTKFSYTFVNLMALAMAVRMGPAITQDKKLTGTLYQQFVNEQRDAWESDANVGNTYRESDEDPNNDTFVNPDAPIPQVFNPRYRD